MRVSPLKTPVAKLRNFLDLHLTEFADAVGCKRSLIQNAELGRRSLSDENALKISIALNVSIEWLLAGDPHAPMLDRQGQPYARESRHFKRKPMSDDLLATDLYWWMWLLTPTLIAAHASDQRDWVNYKLRAVLVPLISELKTLPLLEGRMLSRALSRWLERGVEVVEERQRAASRRMSTGPVGPDLRIHKRPSLTLNALMDKLPRKCRNDPKLRKEFAKIVEEMWAKTGENTTLREGGVPARPLSEGEQKLVAGLEQDERRQFAFAEKSFPASEHRIPLAASPERHDVKRQSTGKGHRKVGAEGGMTADLAASNPKSASKNAASAGSARLRTKSLPRGKRTPETLSAKAFQSDAT